MKKCSWQLISLWSYVQYNYTCYTNTVNDVINNFINTIRHFSICCDNSQNGTLAHLAALFLWQRSYAVIFIDLWTPHLLTYNCVHNMLCILYYIYMYTIIYMYIYIYIIASYTYIVYAYIYFSTKLHFWNFVSSLFATYPDFWLLSGVCWCSSAQQITLYTMAYWLILWKRFFQYHFFVELYEILQNKKTKNTRTHDDQHEFRFENVPHSIKSHKYACVCMCVCGILFCWHFIIHSMYYIILKIVR